ncbi:CGNR zinc finger domain-containing protein [Amycolatopsis decaplanina]|uniref:CGNR zinc finger domain-containing protein n=1 Tax=Amycolatopsis decaplanina TaxID=208441 RepID=UPI000345FD8A|nr:CGNR zinc finger domain-containing protein [Amycolatopsis decaplanina]
MTRKHVIVPPFRDLDPALEVAERLLAQGNSWLGGVVSALPDEHAAADRLNRILAGTGAAPRLVEVANGWRLVQVTSWPGCGDLVAGASGLAELVAFGGWRRLKRCAVCAQAFCDRTAGCSRRWCAGHRPHAESRSGGVL